MVIGVCHAGAVGFAGVGDLGCGGQVALAESRPRVRMRMRHRLRVVAGTRLTADGVLVIEARRHRTQAQNRADARERLVTLLREAARTPRRRRATAPTRASQARRVDSKKRRARTKLVRGPVSGDE